MIIENLPQIGNPILKQKTEGVSDFSDKEVVEIVQNLVDTMRSASLVGMAASQLWITKSIFVTEIRPTKNRKDQTSDELRVFINPKILRISENMVSIYEGCGSVINSQIFAPVDRPESVEIQAYDVDGNKFTLKAHGLLARVIQHEYDHLQGIVFLEKVSDMSKAMYVDEYRKRQVSL
jgi:peptide deformylase